MKKKQKTCRINKSDKITVIVLAVLTVIFFSVAFIRYAPLKESDLTDVCIKVTYTELAAYSRSRDMMIFICGGEKYRYIFPDGSAAKETYDDFKGYVSSHVDETVKIKVINGNNKVAEISYGDKCLSLDEYNEAFQKDRRSAFIFCGVLAFIFLAAYSICCLIFRS